MKLQVRDLAAMGAGVTAEHHHLEVAQINGGRAVLAVNEGPYPWHRHPDADELFVVLEGSLTVTLETGESVTLGPLQALRVPAGTVHRTEANGRTVNLSIQGAPSTTEFVEGGSS